MKFTNMLMNAEKSHYAVGSFSPRYIAMIKPILEAAQSCNSPAIVQISQRELNLYEVPVSEFAKEYHHQIEEMNITVPCALHLDHTKDLEVIKQAIACGFDSVMIDASDKEFEENIEITKSVVQLAHAAGVAVEAELGKIGSTDMIETENDEMLYTDPEEAHLFTEKTGIDALAVSVGTAHGVYTVRKPEIQFDIIRKIKELNSIPLVLHGASGVSEDMVKKAISLPNGGVCKVNIATDLEIAFLESLNIPERQNSSWCNTLSASDLRTGQLAVKELVMTKIRDYLLSDNKVR